MDLHFFTQYTRSWSKRAALYVIVDINFTRNNPERLFYSIGVEAIMVTEGVLVLMSPQFYFIFIVMIPICGTFAVFVHTVCCYPGYLKSRRFTPP